MESGRGGSGSVIFVISSCWQKAAKSRVLRWAAIIAYSSSALACSGQKRQFGEGVAGSENGGSANGGSSNGGKANGASAGRSGGGGRTEDPSAGGMSDAGSPDSDAGSGGAPLCQDTPEGCTPTAICKPNEKVCTQGQPKQCNADGSGYVDGALCTGQPNLRRRRLCRAPMRAGKVVLC